MFNIGPQEVLIILIVALIVVGPKRLPELGRTIGKGLNEFRKLQDEVKDMVKFDLTSPTDFFTPDPAEQPATDEEPEDPDPVTHSERVVALSDEAGEEDDAVADPEPDAVADPVDTTAQDPGPSWTDEPGDTSFLRPVDDHEQPPTAAAE
jgi:Tat protein translocase TatB subunit